MGVIQNAVNLMLGTIGMAARLRPGYELDVEKAKSKKALELSRKQVQSYVGEGAGNVRSYMGSNKPVDEQPYVEESGRYQTLEKSEVLPQHRENIKRAALLGVIGPEEAAKELYFSDPDVYARKASYVKRRNARLIERQEQSLVDTSDKNEAMQTSRRRFKDYAKKLPARFGNTSLGTLGDLGDRAVDEAIKNYSPKDRKKIMDEMDKGENK